MTSTQWELVKQTFEAALDRPQPERSAFIAGACHGDDVVRREVESLLSAHEQDSDFMNEPVGALLPNDEPVLTAGQRFGHYEQIALLGKGGMGQVYVAVDTRLGRKVALKLLPSTLTNDPAYVLLLEREARAASALNHPNIITIHDVGEVGPIHFMTTEFVEGETLRERMSHGPMKISEVLDVALQVAAALQAAHESGIVHRDVKPENIMLRRDGVVKVLDFGLAKLTQQYVANIQVKPGLLSKLQTHAGSIKGTVAYMSPEQTQADDVDSRTDLWSLGVVLYEMVAGRTPFNGDTPEDVMIAIREHDPPPLQQSTASKELLRIISKALSKHPGDRYQTASEIASDLRSVSLTGKRYKPLALIALLLVLVTTIAYIAIDRNKPIPPVTSTNRSTAVLPFDPVDASHRDEILQRQFAADASERPAKRGTTNSEAYRLYLQGMYLANNRNREDAEKAVEILEQAVALDPAYAHAWAGLAYAHRTVSLYTPELTTHDTYQKSMAAINKALSLDQNLSEAHSALCENKYLYEWDFAGAEAECKRAIELDSKSAQAHEIYSRFLMGRGRHEEAIFEIETAIDLEPASRFSQRNYGRALFYARRYSEAASQLERVMEMDQTFVGTYSWLTSALALQGNEAGAFEWFRKLLLYRKTDEATVHIFEKAFQRSGWRGVLSEWLKRMDQIGGTLFDRACYNAQIGNKDQALKHLEQVYQRRQIWMTYLRVDPRLDSLRDDPRFIDLLRRVEGE